MTAPLRPNKGTPEGRLVARILERHPESGIFERVLSGLSDEALLIPDDNETAGERPEVSLVEMSHRGEPNK